MTATTERSPCQSWPKPTTTPDQQNANGWGLKVVDYFIPFNVVALNGADSDFGSGTAVVLPDSAGIAGHPHLMVAGGRENKLYVVDRDNLGHFDASTDHVLNAIPDGSGHNTPPNLLNGLLSTPAWFYDKLYAMSGYSGHAIAFALNSIGQLALCRKPRKARSATCPARRWCRPMRSAEVACLAHGSPDQSNAGL